MDKGVAQKPLASDVGCRGCFLPLPTNDLGLCDNCDAKLERDLIRMRDWEYSAEAFGMPDERLEALRDRAIREYGAAYELLEQSHEYKPKKKRGKSRATQRKREIAAKAIHEYSTDAAGTAREVGSTAQF